MDSEIPSILPTPLEKFEPTEVTFMPTYKCNLKCVYCYSKGGEEIGNDLEWEVAKAAINLIIYNAEKNEMGKTTLGFHGGGEPFLDSNMDLFICASE